MKGYSNHNLAIKQIASELNLDEKQVKNICDNILSTDVLFKFVRHPNTVHFPVIGCLKSELRPSIFNRRNSMKTPKFNMMQLKQHRKKKAQMKQEEVQPKEYYFDLDYIL